MNWILQRLSERTTWLGIITVLTSVGASVGLNISPEMGAQIALVGSSIAGLVLLVTRDNKPSQPPALPPGDKKES